MMGQGGRPLARFQTGPVALLVALLLLVVAVPSNVERSAESSVGVFGDGNGDGFVPGSSNGSAPLEGGSPSAVDGGTGAAGAESVPNSAGGQDASGSGGPLIWGPGSAPPPGPDTPCRSDGAMPDFLPAAPACVPVFAGDNGGATSEGVTASEIRVVVFLNAGDPLLGDTGDTAEQIRLTHETYRRYFNLHRETFRREVVFEYFTGSGLSAEAYRADAIAIAQDHHPFAVMVAEGEAPISFTEELNARGIICICQNGQSREYYRQYPGLSYGLIPSVELTYDHLAEYVIRRLAGDRAEYAGPPPPGEAATYNDQRRFGLIYLNSGTDGVPVPSLTRAADRFQAALAAGGVDLAAKVSYSFDLTRFQTQVTNMISQLRAADVTSVVLVTDFILPISLLEEAERQGFNPEWINGDYLITSYTQAGRYYNQEQWARSFGISPLPLAPGSLDEDPLYQILRATGGGQNYGPGYANYGYDTMTLFDGIHYAGPNLTRATFAQGLFLAPARAGNADFPRVKYSVDDPVLLSDFTEIWWDPNAVGPDEVGNIGPGMTRRSDGGRRFTVGGWPDGPPSIRDRDPNPVTVRPHSPLQDHTADGHQHPTSQRCRSCGS